MANLSKKDALRYHEKGSKVKEIVNVVTIASIDAYVRKNVASISE